MKNIGPKFKVKTFTDSSGVLAAILLDRNSGLPLHYENLYSTIYHHKRSHALATEKSCLEVLAILKEIETRFNLELVDSIKKGKGITETALNQIADCCWSKKEDIYKLGLNKNKSNIVKVHRVESARGTVIIRKGEVKNDTYTSRIEKINGYLNWLIENFSPNEDISERTKRKLMSWFSEIKPSLKNLDSSHPSNLRSLTHEQIDKLVYSVGLDSALNPWCDEGVKFRNNLMVKVFVELGLRKGELLTLKTDSFVPGENTLRVWRDNDNPSETRTDPPSVKTLSRDLEVGFELSELIEIYIMKYRANIKNAEKVPFLFVSHGSVARPLSKSSVNKIFRQISSSHDFNVAPHALRHSWNDEFSELCESKLASGEMTEQEVEDLRSYLMGWAEGSGTAKTYTKRFSQKKAIQYGLAVQRKFMQSAKDYKEIVEMDIPF